MANPQVLALRLEAPLQSWGDSAKWSVRDSRPEPTLSGVLGLVAASAGWRLDADGDRRVAELAKAVRLGVRADREGTSLRDYHTIGGSRSGQATPWTGLLTAEGKAKRNPSTGDLHTEVSERNYLCDACFLVMLEADEATLDADRESPARPGLASVPGPQGVRARCSLLSGTPGGHQPRPGPLCQAISTFPWLGRIGDKPAERLRVVVDEATGATGGLRSLRHDVPESFRHRRFGHRYVREFTVPAAHSPEEV